jgi:tRNA pseudouridine13 synthase
VIDEIQQSGNLLTADLPGLGGAIKTFPEDFEVEEIPAYQPSGQGEHLYLWLEKRDMGAEYFLRRVAQRLGIPPGAIGSAGLKDRHAVTRQWLSVPGEAESRLPDLEGDGIRVLAVSRHGNKLKAGHLHGNRFHILVRNVCAQARERLAPILHRLGREGLPNYYGGQRLGHAGETARIGMALLRREPVPVSASGSKANVRNPFLRKLALSAVQSALFNAYLSRRLADGLFRRILAGEVLAKRPFGGLFVATDTAVEQARFDGRETVHAGPIFGRKTFPACDEAAARELAVLKEAGLTASAFQGFGKLVQGTRRHNVIYLDDLSATFEPEGVRLTLTLPAGSYATVLLREIMKTDLDDEGSAEGRR